MLAILDVHYFAEKARAACVLAETWESPEATRAWTTEVSPIAPYEPGRFYLRELPCLLAVLEAAPRLQHIVIDGYVWLDEARRPGLGAHLHEALRRAVPIVGIAKTAFRGSPMAIAVDRPGSRRPLFVTSAGIDARDAAERVRRMHGPFRIPTLLRHVDHLARVGDGPAPNG